MQGLFGPLQGPRWISQVPQCERQKTPAYDRQLLAAHQRCDGAAAVSFIECQTLFEMVATGLKFTSGSPIVRQCIMRNREQIRVLDALREGEQLLCQVA